MGKGAAGRFISCYTVCWAFGMAADKSVESLLSSMKPSRAITHPAAPAVLRRVVFNVFTGADLARYCSLLTR